MLCFSLRSGMFGVSGLPLGVIFNLRSVTVILPGNLTVRTSKKELKCPSIYDTNGKQNLEDYTSCLIFALSYCYAW